MRCTLLRGGAPGCITLQSGCGGWVAYLLKSCSSNMLQGRTGIEGCGTDEVRCYGIGQFVPRSGLRYKCEQSATASPESGEDGKHSSEPRRRCRTDTPGATGRPRCVRGPGAPIRPTCVAAGCAPHGFGI